MKVSDEEPGSSDESPNESSGLSASAMQSYISGYCVKQGGMVGTIILSFNWLRLKVGKMSFEILTPPQTHYVLFKGHTKH